MGILFPGLKMDKKKSAIRAGAVFVVALAAGHLVQTLNAEKAAGPAVNPTSIEQVSAGKEPSPPATAAPAPAAIAAAPAPAEKDTLLAALPDAGIPEAAAPKETLAALTEPVLPEPVAPVQTPAAKDCAVSLALTASPQAMISVAVTAPCRAGERIVLRHAGLAVAESIPESGVLELDLPALNTEGEVSVLFADATMSRDAVPVPDAASLHRFAVQWMADDAFQLHALEKGADYGQPGHVWAETPVSMDGGYLMALGNPALDLPMMAEVYTWPAGGISADISVEAVVTELSCGRELLGETLQSKDGSVTVTDLTLAMPECDALGDILVLKNPGQDVTLAAKN